LLMFSSSLFAHSVGEMAGLRFVYGPSPDPAVTDQLLNMQWIVRDAASGEPAGNLTDLAVTLTRNGKSWGPFEPEAAWGEPGLYSTAHIFVQPGAYHATLEFRKEGSSEIHRITLETEILDRRELFVD
jgi:hypothetical protein